jgi:flagellar hook-basal body complex protein FliE
MNKPTVESVFRAALDSVEEKQKQAKADVAEIVRLQAEVDMRTAHIADIKALGQ